MQPIDTHVPADTRSCLRYWPVTSAVSIDTTGQTQYQGVINNRLALESDFERLSLTNNETSIKTVVYNIVHNAYISEEIQKLKIEDTQTGTLASNDINMSEDLAFMEAPLDDSAKPPTLKRGSDSADSVVKRQRADTESSDYHLLARDPDAGDRNQQTQPSADPKANESGERSAELFDDYLTLVFQEEDGLPDLLGARPQYFRRIPQIHGEHIVISKRAIRRIRMLLAACTADQLLETVEDDTILRLIGLLTSAIDAADNLGLAAMIKDGSELDKGIELSSEYCQKLDHAFSITCLGLEASSLMIYMAATGKASKTACTSDSLHVATAFFKECLLSCIVPLLGLTPGCSLVDVLTDKNLPLSSRMHALFSTVLLAHDPVISLVGQPALAEQDIISLVFASISVTFCTSELLGRGIDANTFESIRRSAQSLLRQVFETHVEQRTWMLEEILASLIRLPIQKRAMSLYRIAGGKSAQFISVLLLKLLQGTAYSSENLTAGFESGTLSAKEYRMLLQKHKKAVETASSSTDFTVRYLIGRCVKRESKTAAANESEYRGILETFVEDCIVLLGHPQWPAAELVVRVYSLHILELLDEDKSDISLRTLALDSAAQIASHIARTQKEITESASTHASSVLQAVTSSSSLESIERFRSASCLLLEYLQSKVVGGEQTGAIPLYISSWSSMLIAALLKSKRKAAAADGADSSGKDGLNNIPESFSEAMATDSDSDSDTDAEPNTDRGSGSGSDSESESDSQECSDEGSDYQERSSATVKSSKRHGSKAKASARRGLNIEKRKAITACLRDYMVITHRSTRAMPHNLTYASASDTARSLICLLPLYRSFDMLLTRVTMALSASQVTLRSKALRALNQIASQRAAVLYQKNVKYAINHRLQDSSPQVREAAIDLIGKHISQNPELTDQYYEFVSVRVLDKGPSVRKRVLRILREIYLSSTNLTQLVDIGVRILQRTGDDERSIRELATKMLQELWFTSGDHATFEDDDGVRVEATGNIFNLLSPDSQREMLKRVRVMTGVMEAARSSDLSELMAGLFSHVTTKTSNAEAEEAMLVIRCVIDALFEQLLRSEESSTESIADNEMTVDNTATASVDLSSTSASSAIFSTAACLRFISALSLIAPDAVGQHSEMLSAYLKMTNASEEDMLHNVLCIFNNTLLCIPHPSSQFLGSLESDLISLLASSPQGILSIAVPCLCTLVEKITWNYGKLIRLFRSCALQLYREHRRIAVRSNTNPMSAKNVMRFIVLAGLTCRYFDFDKHRIKQSEHFKDLDTVIKGTVPDFMNETLLFFATSSLPQPVQLAAIQMLGQIYIKKPQLALEARSRTLMDKVFSEGSAGHKLQVMRNFLEFLRADSKRYAQRLKEEQGKVREVDAKALVGDTGDMSVAGVGASLMQTYLDRIIEATFLPGASALLVCGFEVISLVLEQGLAHPLKCVPALIALGTSSDAHIRSKALKLHQDLCFKYASFIHSRDIEGVRLAYEYQVQVRGSPESVAGFSDSADVRDAPNRPVAYLQPLYSQLRSKRMRRNDFLTLLVKIGDCESGTSYMAGGSGRSGASDTKSGGSGNDIDIQFVRFVAENLASLDYKYLDEVLHVIYQISAIIASTGLNLYHHFEAESQAEAGARAGARTGSSAGSRPATETKLRLSTKGSVCISILFALREFLKMHYSISETRCTAYNPSDTSAARDKPVTWHAQDSSGSGSMTSQGRIVWDACNPYAVRPMSLEADFNDQRLRFRQQMAGSLAVAEESSVAADTGSVFDSHGNASACAAEDDAFVDPEELELLSMGVFDAEDCA
ncbi:Sister chromatid cohesion protein 2 [Coemansia sp. RSA 1722]|nr:Sister chromatid cohesion protein 2 [Coemansia sp. RSA 1722]